MLGGIPMLKSFKITNAYSFFEECEVTMVATNILAHKYSLITSKTNKHVPEGVSLLPALSIYGANASGKTNLLRALLFIFEAINRGSDNSFVSNAILNTLFTKAKNSAAKNEATENEPTKLELVFYLNKDEYRLRFEVFLSRFEIETLEQRKNSKGRWLNIYRRNWNFKTDTWELNVGTTVSGTMRDEIKYVHSMETENKSLLLHALCKRKKKETVFASLALWTSGFNEMKMPASQLISQGTVLTTHEKNPHLKILNDKLYKMQILDFVKFMSPNIKDYVFDENKNEDKNRFNLSLSFEYDIIATNNQVNFDKILSHYESRGVYSAMTLLPSVFQALHEGGLVIADELENSLHPLLMLRVINLFNDPEINKGGGQLIFTTHNALIMDKRYLRKDQIGFTEKNQEGHSEFYKLSDIDGVRSDLDFSKNYILGAFGAVPEV